MERRLQNDGFLLSQISSVVIDTQKACRQAAAARQSRVSQAISKGDVIEERLIAVLVDYPIEKERTTTLIERVFYEREYVRQTRLRKEIHLKSYNEELHRRTVNKNSDGSIPRSSSPTAENLHSDPLPNQKATPFAQNGEQSSENIERGKAETPTQPGMSHPRPHPEVKNPFKDFVQPRQQTPPSQTPLPALPAPPPQASALGNGGQVSKSKSKKKFGLKWFFSAPFKTGKERKPDMEEVSDSNTADTNSDVLSSRGLEDDRRLGSPAEQTPHAPLALTNAPHESTTAPPPSKAVENGADVVKKPGYNHEEAVRKALQEGSADESQRELFTQIEEERNTIERVERYVDHQYYLREYVIRVTCVGERSLGQNLEFLQLGQFLRDGDRLGKQVPATYPVTVV